MKKFYLLFININFLIRVNFTPVDLHMYLADLKIFNVFTFEVILN